MKQIAYIAACVVVPIAWGAIVHWLFHHGSVRLARRRAVASSSPLAEELEDRELP